MTPATAYRIRNLPTRLRGIRAEIHTALGLGLTGELRARHLRADVLTDLALDHGMHDVLVLVRAYVDKETGHDRNRMAERLFRIVDERPELDGAVLDYGILSRRLVTDDGVAFLVDAFTNTAEPENFNYHAAGTGGTAEATTDSALVTEVESRDTGTQSQPSANVYQTVGTVSFTATRSIVEHGIFDQSALGGTLWDRSVFTSIGVDNGDAIEFTYQLTVNSGG